MDQTTMVLLTGLLGTVLVTGLIGGAMAGAWLLGRHRVHKEQARELDASITPH